MLSINKWSVLSNFKWEWELYKKSMPTPSPVSSVNEIYFEDKRMNDNNWPSSDPDDLFPCRVTARVLPLASDAEIRDPWTFDHLRLGAIYINRTPSQASSSQSVLQCPSALCDSLPPASEGTIALGPVTWHLHHQWQKLWDVKYSGNLSSWMSGDTGLLLVTEAENICQNVINMGLVTITMGRRWHWEMNSCTVISNIYSLLQVTWLTDVLMILGIAEYFRTFWISEKVKD